MLDQMLFQIATSYPEKEALISNQQRLVYRELYEQVAGLGAGLAQLGIQETDIVAILLPNSIEFVLSFCALARLKAIVLPLNPLLKDAEVEKIFQETPVKALITDQRHVANFQNLALRLGKMMTFITSDQGEAPLHYLYNLIQSGKGQSEPVEYEGNVLCQYSSGSTGRPKQLYRTQHNLFWEARDFTETAHITADDCIFCAIPFFHAHGLGNCLLAALYSGARLVILEQATQEGGEAPFASRCPRVFELIKKERPTIFPGVAPIFDALALYPATMQSDLSSLRLCFTAGNTLPKDVFERFLARFGLPIRQLYGCTEAGSVTINLAEGAAFAWDSAGRPMVNVDVKIVDEEGQMLPVGVPGEIAFKSPALTSSYHNLTELNARVFKDGYFFTGDLGKIDKNGYIYITGRKRVFIDTGGYKVDPLEVEEVLKAYPGVNEVVVVGVPMLSGGDLVKAVVVPEKTLHRHGLLSWCKERLADFKVPRIIEMRSELPRNALGKILHKDLMEKLIEPGTQQGAFGQQLMAQTSERQRRALVETYLKSLCAEIFSLAAATTIESDKPFGDFGLDSISALEIIDRLEFDLDITLPVTLLWSYSTISALASYLSHLQSISASSQFTGTQGESGDEGRSRDTQQTGSFLTDEEAHRLLTAFLKEDGAHEEP